ncbi:putative pectate lyase 3, partial [Mucuna pruriens]
MGQIYPKQFDVAYTTFVWSPTTLTMTWPIPSRELSVLPLSNKAHYGLYSSATLSWGRSFFSSNKTIDGRGVNVQIKNDDGLTMQYMNNVNIHGICIKKIMPKDDGMIRDSYNHFGLRTRSDGDAISLFGASNIWIDHVSLSNFIDGLIDVIKGSIAVTISNCHMTKHNDVIIAKVFKEVII